MSEGSKGEMVGLVSGGKDSMYNLMCAVRDGWRIAALANLYPREEKEMDSYMYQTVGSEGIQMIADAMGVPLYRRPITGESLRRSYDYEKTEGDEVEDLFELLQEVKRQHPAVKGVSAGAILSSYQKLRVENVCDRLKLEPACYLWEREQEELLREMIDGGVQAVLIKVAAIGLKPIHLGTTLQEMQSTLLTLRDKYGVHPCGEGGEFESFVLDSPLMRKRIKILESEVVMHQSDDIAPVAYLRLKKLALEDKA